MTEKSIQERVTALEVQMLFLMNEQSEIKTALADSNKKLDELLGLRNKGVGAFWLISSLAGTGILGLFYAVIDWIKG